MAVPGVPFTEGQSRNANRLADGLLPLAAWVEEKTTRFVPDATVPWRTGQPLTAANIGFDRFLEGLLVETSEDSDLKARWDWLAEDPLRLCPIAEVTAWRAVRGFAPRPRFSVVVTDNVITDADARLVSRAEFYLPFWDLLDTAYTRADRAATALGGTVDELRFAAELLDDTSAFWPGGGPQRASRFCKQFVKDLLYCYLGLRNPREEPWRDAVLIELGERRRVGNMYSPEDCAAAVELFNKTLMELRAAPLPEVPKEVAPRRRSAFAHSVGAPPVNARDLA